MHRFPRPASHLFVGLLLGVTLAACSSSDDATFASATDAQIYRALGDASGLDAAELLFASDSAGENDAVDCPTITTVGNLTTLTGACKSPDGEHVDGKVTIENAPWSEGTNPDYDASKPTTVSFSGYRVTDASGALKVAVDGTLALTGGNAHATALEGHWTMTSLGVTTTTDLTLAIGSDDQLVPSDSHVTIDDLGGATVDGSWNLNVDSGTLTLHGDDDIVFDMSHAGDDCMPYTIGGKAGSVCEPADSARVRPAADAFRLKPALDSHRRR